MKPARTWKDHAGTLLERSYPYYFDIGSSVTKVIYRNRLIFCEPSCIAIHKDTGAVTALGSKAYALVGKHSPAVQVVFPMQRGSIASLEYFELFLKALATTIGVPQTLTRIFSGISGGLVVAANLSPVNTEYLATCLSRSGFGRVSLLNKPRAIIAHRLSKTDEHPVGVIDIGGQTTEVSILSAGEVVQSAVLPWGGVPLTELVQQAVVSEYRCALGWQAAEEVKRHTGWVGTAATKSSDKFRNTKYATRGKDTTTQTVKTVVVSAAIFEPSMTEQFEELVEGLHDFFDAAPTELTTAVFNRGLVLSGGGSLLRGMPDSLGSVFECEIATVDRPELDAVEGLAALAEDTHR